MLDFLNYNFDSDGDGILDSVAQGADLDGDGVIDAMLVDLGNDGTVDCVAMDYDANGELDTVVFGIDTDQNGEMDTFALLTDTDADQNFDAMEIYGCDEESGDLELLAEVEIDECEELNAEDLTSEASDLDLDLAEIDGRLNKGIQRPSFGASQGTCRASHTNQNYCVFAGF